MKKFALSFVILSLVAVLLTACGGSGSCGGSSSGSSSGSTPTVHMCGNNFVQSSITISKGQSLTLVNDSHMIGPFPTAGTYHLYCTVHPGMNLTVIVH